MMGALSRLHRQARLLVLLIVFGLRLLLTGSAAALTPFPSARSTSVAQIVPTAPSATTTSTTEPAEANGAASWSNFTPTGWVTSNSTTVSVQVDDSDGLNLRTAQWRLSTNGGSTWGAWTPASASYTGPVTTTATIQASVTELVEGTTLSQVQFKIDDTAALPASEESPAYPIKVDVTAPGAPTGLAATPDTWTVTNNFSLSWTNPADTSGIAGAYYKLDSPPTSATDGTFVSGADLNTINNVTVNGSGSHTVYVWLKDQAGNVDPANQASTTLKFDSSAPAAPTNLTVTPDGWTNVNQFSFQWTNPSELSGIAGVWYRLDTPPIAPNNGTYVAGDNIQTLSNLTFSGLTQGQHTLYIWLEDKLGNVDHGNRASVVFKYDSLPPSAGLVLTGTTGNGGWYRSPVQVQVVLTDTHSGPGQAEYKVDNAGWSIGTSFEVSDEGQHTILFRGTDAAGNQSNAQSKTIKIDSGAPQITLAASGQVGNNGWFKSSPVMVTLTATDTVSGVAQTYYREGPSGSFLTGNNFQVSGEGEHLIYYYANDWAGNGPEGVYTSTIPIDSRAPQAIPYALTAERVWQRTNSFTVTWSAVPDDTSGIGGAYFKLDSPPTSNTDYHGIGTELLAVRNVRVGSEGKHHIYVWLYDKAGNTNYLTHRSAWEAFWLDQTPPSTTPSQVDGTIWYTEPVTITLTADDQVGLSGVKETRYRIVVGNTVGPWQTGNVAVANGDGRNIIRYYSVDNAGNIETEKWISVQVDLTPPPVPTGLQVSSAGTWKKDGCYTVTWAQPMDASGVVKAYYKIGDPPTSDEDYLHVEPISGGSIACLKDVPVGKNLDLYLWLGDRAGNADYRNAAVLQDAIWWDSVRPVTELSMPEPTGDNGWHTQPVSVTLSATDLESGVSSTYYRIDYGPWQSGAAFEIRTQGDHTVYYYSTDVAGNKESEKSRKIKVDLTPPSAYILPLTPYQPRPNFLVQWQGADSENGSGVVGYDVEVLDGTGSWKPWLSGTAATQAEFKGERGHVYYFRVRARDAAGWRSPVTTDKSNAPYAYVEPVENGDFETGTLNGWSTQGMVAGQQVSVVTFDGPTGAKSQMALLGDPGFPVNSENIPIGDAPIQQTIRVPSAEELPDSSLRLELTLDYDIWTCDSISSGDPPGSGNIIEVDSFDVLVGPSGGKLDRVIHDGNQDPNTICDENAIHPITSPQDLGWKRARKIDLKPYMGSTIVIRFTTTSRKWPDLNTYTYVDNIAVKPPSLPCRACLDRRVFLPVFLQRSPARSTAMQLRQMAPPPPVAPTVEPSPPTPGRPPKRG